jgi:hypothetical protein
MRYLKIRKPGATPVFLGLLLAALARMVWFWALGKKVFDPIGLTAISLALVVLIYQGFFHRRRKE